MQLLNTTTFELEEFFGANIPPYAILSHRWGIGEVTFKDLMEGKGPGKVGWVKVVGCCTQARNEGLEYAWIDSCCIDKSSSAELSEAINSMFRFYRASKVCYAYLADVPEGERDHYDIRSSFRGSKWFTRGWTLQELLAPPTLVFYNRAWIEVGTKKSLETLVSAITSIEHIFGFEQASVAQKMSWASRRETLREEDMAYCLMGLFGINMPPLYGEGENAFLRLQNEIIKISDDESIFAWMDDTLPDGISGLLARSPAAFKDSWNVESLTRSRSAPYSMTNKGLQINLSLSSRQRTRAERIRACKNGATENSQRHVPYTAVICCSRKGQGGRLGLKLVKPFHLREEYSRVSCNELDEVPYSYSLSGSPRDKTIFVHQDYFQTEIEYM